MQMAGARTQAQVAAEVSDDALLAWQVVNFPPKLCGCDLFPLDVGLIECGFHFLS